MKSFGCQCLEMVRDLKTGVEIPIRTRTTAAVVTATGAAECIEMHSGQGLVLLLLMGWTCATWTAVSSATRKTHTITIAGHVPGLLRRMLRVCAPIPVNEPSFGSRIHKL